LKFVGINDPLAAAISFLYACRQAMESCMEADPMEEGELAAADGKPLSDNPYPAGSDAHEKWAKGWYYHHFVNEDGEPLDDA
jgi:hypothetical protein